MARSVIPPLGRYGLLLGIVCAMGTAPAAAAPSDPTMDFDIPAQPLEAALNRYSEIAQISALYPGDLPAGLDSAPVHGRYSPEEALRRLLQGTGVILDKMSTAHGDVFRLTRGTAQVAADIGGASHWASATNGFLPRLQADVMRALCGDARTVPGGYRAMFEISVDAQGGPDKTTLISASGDARRDAALLEVLEQVHTSPPPAASARVPYLFTLRPAAPGAPSPCLALTQGEP